MRSTCVVASCHPLWYAVRVGGTIKSPLLYQLSYAPGCRKHLPTEQLRQVRVPPAAERARVVFAPASRLRGKLDPSTEFLLKPPRRALDA